MAVTAADLKDQIDPNAAQFATMMTNLQGNILKGHGRRSTRNLFLTVISGKASAARAGMKALAQSGLMTSARKQLDETKLFKQNGTPGGPVVFAFISRAGYKAMKVAAAKIPTDAAFADGMSSAARRQILSDPPTANWLGFPAAPHAMVIVGDASEALCRAKEAEVLATLGSGWKVSHSETGQAIFDDDGEGLEHFGYVDGRSQPLMLEGETGPGAEPVQNWNAAFGPGIVLVDDPAAVPGSDGKGSYFVFRKLEQDVAGFKAAEAALADAQLREAKAAGVPEPDRELAGAMMVGRFENGAPVLQFATPEDNSTPPENNPANNDFTYASDPNGTKCPLHAHIRKTNPRDNSERTRIMARRGIPYGGAEGSGAPVGLLFMSYNRDIATQFEFTQQSWANNINFPFTGTVHGVDPIIGQSAGRRAPYANCPIAHGNATNHVGEFPQYVTMRGGEYFFAPSISGLKNL